MMCSPFHRGVSWLYGGKLVIRGKLAIYAALQAYISSSCRRPHHCLAKHVHTGTERISWSKDGLLTERLHMCARTRITP